MFFFSVFFPYRIVDPSIRKARWRKREPHAPALSARLRRDRGSIKGRPCQTVAAWQEAERVRREAEKSKQLHQTILVVDEEPSGDEREPGPPNTSKVPEPSPPSILHPQEFKDTLASLVADTLGKKAHSPSLSLPIAGAASISDSSYSLYSRAPRGLKP